MRIESAGIIGTGWGRTHVGTLRAAGVEVRRLCGRDLDKTRSIARAEGVPEATDRLEALRDLDLVVIATPPATHAELLGRFPGQLRLLEKPALGVPPPSAPLPEPDEPVWVNYAFPFLDVARQASAALAELGSLRRGRVGARLCLDGEHDLRGWFMEVAAHPLSYAIHLFGPLQTEAANESANRLDLRLRAGSGVPVEAWVALEGPPGIGYTVELEAEGGVARFGGELRLGEGPWRFGPLEVNGRERPLPQPDMDPWIAANHAAVGALVRHLRDGGSAEAAHEAGLFDLDRGLLVERALGLHGSVRGGLGRPPDPS